MFKKDQSLTGITSPTSNRIRSAGLSIKSNKTLLYGLYAIGAGVAIAVLVWGVYTFLGHSTLDESFFVSNDVKTTIALTPDNPDTTSLNKTYVVYDYNGEEVVSMKTYFEYPDEAAARATYEAVKDQPEFVGAVINGKYIIVTADESQFKGLTASDVRQQAEAIKAFQESQAKEKAQE